MIFWLDHRIFGNGYGLKSPYFDDRFYWLNGRVYTWIGGFGAQFQSIQWRHPRAGEERTILGRKFRPLHSERQWLWLWHDKIFSIPLPIGRVRVSWSCSLPGDVHKAGADLRELQSRLLDRTM